MNALQTLKKQIIKLREEKEPIIIELQNRIESQEGMIRALTGKLLTYQNKISLNQVSTLDSSGLLWKVQDKQKMRKLVIVDVSALAPEAIFISNIEAKIISSTQLDALCAREHTKLDEANNFTKECDHLAEEVTTLQSVVAQLRVQMCQLKRKYEQNVDQQLLSITNNNAIIPQKKETLSTPEILLKQSLGLSSDKEKLETIKEEKKSLDLSIAEISSLSMGQDLSKEKVGNSPENLRKQHSLPPQMKVDKKEQMKASGKSEQKQKQIVEVQEQKQSDRDNGEEGGNGGTGTGNLYQQLKADRGRNEENNRSSGKERSRKSSRDDSQLKLTAFIDRNDKNIDDKIQQAPLRKMLISPKPDQEQHTLGPSNLAQQQEIEISRQNEYHQIKKKPQDPRSADNPVQSIDQSNKSENALAQKQEQKKVSNSLEATENVGLRQATKYIEQLAVQPNKPNFQEQKSATYYESPSIQLKLVNGSPVVEGRSEHEPLLAGNLAGADSTESVNVGKNNLKGEKSEGNISQTLSIEHQVANSSAVSPLNLSKINPSQLSHISQISSNEKSHQQESAEELNNMLVPQDKDGEKTEKNMQVATQLLKTQEKLLVQDTARLQAHEIESQKTQPESHSPNLPNIQQGKPTDKIGTGNYQSAQVSQNKPVPTKNTEDKLQSANDQLAQQQEKTAGQMIGIRQEKPEINQQSKQEKEQENIRKMAVNSLKTNSADMDSAAKTSNQKKERQSLKQKERPESRHKKKKHLHEEQKSKPVNWSSLFSTFSDQTDKKKDKLQNQLDERSKDSQVPKQEGAQSPGQPVKKQQKEFETPKKLKLQSNNNEEVLKGQEQSTPVWKLLSSESLSNDAAQEQNATTVTNEVKKNEQKQQNKNLREGFGPEQTKQRFSFQSKVSETVKTESLSQQQAGQGQKEGQKIKQQSNEDQLKEQQQLDRLLQQLNQEQEKLKRQKMAAPQQKDTRKDTAEQISVRHDQQSAEVPTIDRQGMDLKSQIKELFSYGTQRKSERRKDSEKRQKEEDVDQAKQDGQLKLGQNLKMQEGQSVRQSPESPTTPHTQQSEDRLQNFMVISGDYSDTSEHNKNDVKAIIRKDEKPNKAAGLNKENQLIPMAKSNSEEVEKHEVDTKFNQVAVEGNEENRKKALKLNIKPVVNQFQLKIPELPVKQFEQKTPYPHPYSKKASEESQRKPMVEDLEYGEGEGEESHTQDEKKAQQNKEEKKKEKSKIIHFRKR